MRVAIVMKKGELPKAIKAYKDASELAWKKVIDNVLIDLHTLSPVDTGLLRNSYIVSRSDSPVNPNYQDVSQTPNVQSSRVKLFGYKSVLTGLTTITNYQPYQSKLDGSDGSQSEAAGFGKYPFYFYNAAVKEANRHRLGLR